MYPDLFKGLGFKLEDLTTYSSPLVSFEGKMVVPKGQIRLPVQTGSDVVEVSKGKIPFWRSSAGDSGKPIYG